MTFTLCTGPPDLMMQSTLPASAVESSPPQPSGGETASGQRERPAEVGPKSEGVNASCIQAKPLSVWD